MADPFLHHRERYSLSLSLPLSLPLSRSFLLPFFPCRFFVTHDLHHHYQHYALTSPPTLSSCFSMNLMDWRTYIYTWVYRGHRGFSHRRSSYRGSRVDIVGWGALFTIKLVRCKSARHKRNALRRRWSSWKIFEEGGEREEAFVPFLVQGFLARGRKEEGALLPVETPRACFARILLDSAVVLQPEGPRLLISYVQIFLVSAS